MSHHVIIQEEAQADALDAFLYYEKKREGLGLKFLDELVFRYKQIADNPRQFGYLHADKEKSLRKIKVNGFPYILVYGHTDTLVVVYLCIIPIKTEKKKNTDPVCYFPANSLLTFAIICRFNSF